MWQVFELKGAHCITAKTTHISSNNQYNMATGYTITVLCIVLPLYEKACTYQNQIINS